MFALWNFEAFEVEQRFNERFLRRMIERSNDFGDASAQPLPDQFAFA